MTLTTAPPKDPINLDATKVLFEEARQRRRRRWLVGLCLVLVAGASLVVTFAASGGARHLLGDRSPSGQSATNRHLVAPPAVSPHASHLWLSATRVPTSGAHLAAAVVNTTGQTISYGVLGTLDRWTGTRWTADGAWVSSLDQWGGFPVAGGPVQGASVFLIGLSAPAHRVGNVQYFSLPALSAGWYRVGYPGGRGQPSVFGVIHATPSVPGPASISNPFGPQLIADPTIMRTSGDVSLMGNDPNQGTASQENQFNQGLASTVTIQRWNGRAWVFAATRTVDEAPPLQNGNTVVTLPKLRPGAYRILRRSATAGQLERVIWVVPSLPREPQA